jgi:phosphotransferase system IIA component
LILALLHLKNARTARCVQIIFHLNLDTTTLNGFTLA